MSAADPTYRPPLGSHRLLGQGVGAALIQPFGGIDWWCPDRFHATPQLWSLLDRDGGRSVWCGAEAARWDACPAGPTARTTVRIDGRRIELWDGLLRLGDGSILIRLVRSEGEAIALEHELVVGGFGSPPDPWRQDRGRTVNDAIELIGGTSADIDGHRATLRVAVTPTAWSGFAIRTLAADDLDGDPAGLIALMRRADDLDRAEMSELVLPRRHPSRAVDALRVLRALTDPVSGAPVAAPTTSLPEAPGGSRQFDYRFSWLRDSALGVTTASLLGDIGAAARYIDFVAGLLDRVDGELQPLTTSRGDPVPAERDVAGVAGWAGSQPVRVGNEASGQRQVDALATVIEAVWTFANNGGTVDARRWRLVEQLADMLAAAPDEPTSGIWELRTPKRLVSEEIARWHGLDRAIRLRRRYRPWRRRGQWVGERDEARRRIEAAFDPVTGRLPQSFEPGDATPDAAVLTLAMAGFWPRRDRRLRPLVVATVAALEEGPFLRRYPAIDDGFDGTEASFLPAAWWAVTALAAAGDLDQAWSRADDLCAQLPRLQPEQWDSQAGAALGNTPLLWSHTEAARALYYLERAQLRRRVGAVGVRLWIIARFVRVRRAARRRRRAIA